VPGTIRLAVASQADYPCKGDDMKLINSGAVITSLFRAWCPRHIPLAEDKSILSLGRVTSNAVKTAPISTGSPALKKTPGWWNTILGEHIRERCAAVAPP